MILRWFISLVGAVLLVACDNQGSTGAQATTHAPQESASTPTLAAPAPVNYTVTTVPVSGGPVDVAVDPVTHNVYVINDTGLVLIDGSTHAVTAPVPGNANGVAVDPGAHTVYVTRPDGTMSVIDGSTRKVTATVRAEPGLGKIALDPGTHTVYVTNSNRGTVSVIESR